jgi:hypothetical protein
MTVERPMRYAIVSEKMNFRASGRHGPGLAVGDLFDGAAPELA